VLPQNTADKCDAVTSAAQDSVVSVEAGRPVPTDGNVGVIKLSLVVNFGSKAQRAIVGLAAVSNADMTEQEHATFASRAARATSGIDTSAEFCSNVRRRLGRANGSSACAVYTLPLAQVIARGGGSDGGTSATGPGAARKALVERDRYRALLLSKEAELADLAAAVPRRVEEAAAASVRETERLRGELVKAQAQLKAAEAERVEMGVAFDTFEQSLQQQAARTKALVDAVAAAFPGQSAANVDEAIRVLQERR
jgi:hypothetical protein